MEIMQLMSTKISLSDTVISSSQTSRSSQNSSPEMISISKLSPHAKFKAMKILIRCLLDLESPSQLRESE